MRSKGRGAGALAGVLLLFLLGASPAAAAQDVEEILSYDVTVELLDGNRMVVTEDITVRALGREIRRGIYRDFPTSFPRWIGLGRIEAPFQVLDVERDGEPEPWVLERIGASWGRGGVRVRIGDADVLLDAGVHRYRLRYETWRWIEFGDQADALYWNVTGNGWAFPIQEASARVLLPRPVAPDSLAFEVWTGPDGSTASDATFGWDEAEGAAVARTTAPLDPGEGLTLRLTLPKGVVEPPSAEAQAEWFRLDWGGYVDAARVALLVLAFYLIMWLRVGRDPARGVVVVRYEPPAGYSPAALGFLDRRGYDDSQLAASIVSLAVRGAVRIEQEKSDFTLHRTTDSVPEGTPDEEAGVFKALLGARSSLSLSSSHSSTFQKAVKGLKEGLARRMERRYFVLNRRWFAVGVGVSVLGFAVLAWRDRYGIAPEAWFLGVWLTFWTLGAGTLAYRVVVSWRAALGGGGPLAWSQAVFLSLFSTPFLVAEVVVAGLLLTMVPQSLALAAVLLGAVNVVFYHLLERPTLRGRGVLDALEGFRRFLTAADADRLDRMNPPERTPELFERYLPHAIALGVENRWAESFQDVLSPAAAAAGGVALGSSSGALAWYSGGGASNLSGVASALGRTFSHSLSSASSPPPSSGGSSGGGSSSGGSSGGGGGGGGGGGW